MADSLPQFGVGIIRMPDGKHRLVLEILTAYTKHEFYIGDAGNYIENARVIHEGIIAAGKEAARADSGIVVMNGDGGDMNAIIQAEGRKQSATRRKG